MYVSTSMVAAVSILLLYKYYDSNELNMHVCIGYVVITFINEK